jgi:hypothetical protein
MRTDREVNSDAISWGCDSAAVDDRDSALPCIQVAGVTVWLYREDGVMRVSVDLDDVNGDTPMVDPDGERRVPMQITVQGHAVYEAH